MILRILFTVLWLCVGHLLLTGQANLRGNVYDHETGEPIVFGTIRLEGTAIGTNTDLKGFFSLGNVPAGQYTLVVTYIGYDSLAIDVQLQDGNIEYRQLRMRPNAVNLSTVDVSASREKARSDVQVSKLRVTPKQIRSLPSTGGDADIAQYLPIIPGVIVASAVSQVQNLVTATCRQTAELNHFFALRGRARRGNMLQSETRMG